MAQSFFQYDEYFMREALALAEKGRGKTGTNPLVGAVIVRNKKIIGKGYHKRFGGPHAEINALRNAQYNVTGATLYVTLEPCSTHGKTPPCTDAILASGITRVVIAVCDSNPVHMKKGVRILRSSGINVCLGVLRAEAEKQNETFFTVMRKKRPYIILKMAQSLDGKSATRTGDAHWISSLAARRFVHTLRKEVDAVMVGRGTAAHDDPLLSVRLVKTRHQPVRIILDQHASLPLTLKVFKTARKQKTIIVASQKASLRRISDLKTLGVQVITVPLKKNRLHLSKTCALLANEGIGRMLIEGGGTVAGTLFDEKLVDKCYFFTAPCVIGGRTAFPSVAGDGVRCVKNAITFKNSSWRCVGDDMLFEGEV